MHYKCTININVSGYTHIDSASVYKNGKDIRVPKREDVFITSKISPQE